MPENLKYSRNDCRKGWVWFFDEVLALFKVMIVKLKLPNSSKKVRKKGPINQFFHHIQLNCREFWFVKSRLITNAWSVRYIRNNSDCKQYLIITRSFQPFLAPPLRVNLEQSKAIFPAHMQERTCNLWHIGRLSKDHEARKQWSDWLNEEN